MIHPFYQKQHQQDPENIQKLCNLFVSWCIHYAILVYGDDYVPFEKHIDNVTKNTLDTIYNDALLSYEIALSSEKRDASGILCGAVQIAQQMFIPGVQSCLDEMAALASEINNTDYVNEARTIQYVALNTILE